MKLIKIIFFLSIWSQCAAQSDTLNRVDMNGEKMGWWIIYLDANLAELKDSTNAVYSRYGYFKGKFNYFNMGPIGTAKNPIIAPKGQSGGEIQLLNGIYKANYDDGQVKYELNTLNGKFIYYKEYYTNGVLKSHFAYTESCGDDPFQYCIYQYKKDGSLKNKSTIRLPE